MPCVLRGGQAVHSSNSSFEQLPAFFPDSREERQVLQQSLSERNKVQSPVLANICLLGKKQHFNSCRLQTIGKLCHLKLLLLFQSHFPSPQTLDWRTITVMTVVGRLPQVNLTIACDDEAFTFYLFIFFSLTKICLQSSEDRLCERYWLSGWSSSVLLVMQSLVLWWRSKLW